MYQHIIDYYADGFSIIARAGCRREDEDGRPDEAAILYANAEWFWLAMCQYMRAQGDLGNLGSKRYRHPVARKRRRR